MPNKIGRFEIQAEISRSSTGSVNKACDPAGGQIVALKAVDLKPFGPKAPAVIKRILEEAEGSKLLNTHNIAMLFGAGEIDGQFCATMEYVQGNSIETMLARKEVFTIWDVQDIARQSCQGLDHARVNKVLHYSMEPSKVMVQWDGIVKLLGFGVSMIGVFAAEISPGIPKILHYASPEQLNGSPIDASSNLFSLGAILYEMVTQRRAFDGDDANQVRQSVLQNMPVPPCELNTKIDPALSNVIMKALSKAPAERYQSGQELINDLEKCKNSPIKSSAANKTVPLPAAFKAPQQEKSADQQAAKLSVPAATLTRTEPNITLPVPQTSAMAAGAGVAAPGTGNLQSLKGVKPDPSPQFITTCIKASIDAVIEPKMSVATAEPEVKAPKLNLDPMMDESRRSHSKPSKSFSEIDELPPLKEVSVAAPPPAVVKTEVDDEQYPPDFESSDRDKEGLQAHQIAKHAVAEIQKTPPKMFAYSIGVAIAIILAIGAIILFRIHSDGADDDGGSASPTTATSAPEISVPASPAIQAPVSATAGPAEPEAEGSQVSVKAKYAAKKKTKTVTAATAAPAVVPAQLMVSSNPAGAQVQVDGRSDPNWITPYNISGLTPGQHTVYINKSGYATEIRSIEAVAGGKSTVTINFRQLPATIFLVSAPAGASIVLDGKETGQVTPAQMSIDKPGTHVFLIKKQGFLEETTTANIAPGQTFHYSPTLIGLGNTDEIKTVGKLKKMFGSSDPTGMGTVSIKIQPKGAQIAVNNRLLEKGSPVDFYLNPGTYVVDITTTGFKSAHHVITVIRGGKVTLDETLERQ